MVKNLEAARLTCLHKTDQSSLSWYLDFYLYHWLLVCSPFCLSSGKLMHYLFACRQVVRISCYHHKCICFYCTEQITYTGKQEWLFCCKVAHSGFHHFQTHLYFEGSALPLLITYCSYSNDTNKCPFTSEQVVVIFTA